MKSWTRSRPLSRVGSGHENEVWPAVASFVRPAEAEVHTAA